MCVSVCVCGFALSSCRDGVTYIIGLVALSQHPQYRSLSVSLGEQEVSRVSIFGILFSTNRKTDGIKYLYFDASEVEGIKSKY